MWRLVDTRIDAEHLPAIRAARVAARAAAGQRRQASLNLFPCSLGAPSQARTLVSSAELVEIRCPKSGAVAARALYPRRACSTRIHAWRAPSWTCVRGRLGRVWCRRRERSATTMTPSRTGSASPC
jgi:hypothetical protein